MALEDLTPAVRVEGILDGANIEPATRLEYFLSKAANEVPKPAGSSDAGKVMSVNSGGTGYELTTPSSGGGVPFVEQTLPISVKWENSTQEIYGVILFVCDDNEMLNTDYYAIVLPDDEYAKLTGHYGFAGFSPDGYGYTVAAVNDWVTPWTVDAPADTSSLVGRRWVQPITSVDVRYVVQYYDKSDQSWKDLVLVKASEVEYDVIDT